MNPIKIIFFVLAIMLSQSLFAVEVGSKQAEFGFLKSSGNTDNEKVNLALYLNHQVDAWNHDFALNYYQGESDGESDADNFKAQYTLSRSLTDRLSVFSEASYLDDDFDGFTEQWGVGAGVDYLFVDSESLRWSVGTGIGYRDTNELITLDDDTRVEGRDLSNVTYLLRSDSLYRFSDTSTIENNFKADIGSENTFIENQLSLSVSMNNRLALKAAYLVRHNTDPAETSDKTDTIMTINLVYKLIADK